MRKQIFRTCSALAIALALISGSASAVPEQKVSAEELITQLQVADAENAADWSIQTNLQIGDLQFGDREVTYVTIPEHLLGADYIRSAADSKSYTEALVSFTASDDLSVYIALDDRVEALPEWLSAWTDTGEELVNSNQVVFSLYTASFTQGETITLGANGQSSGCVNYSVVVKAVERNILRGDLNADGERNILDLILLQRWLLAEDVSLPEWRAGDLLEDGILNIYDLGILKQELLSSSSVPFTVAEGLFDQTNTDTLSLSYPDGLETVTVWKAEETGDHYCNGVCLAAYQGKLYCQWQSSETDEDSADTHVMYSVSSDLGRTWSKPMVLAQNIGDGYCTSGGWLAAENQLVAYINFWPTDLSPRGGYTYYTSTQDGETWSQPQQVMMADGTPMNAIFEQDPHVLASGRIVNSAHFQEGLVVCPIYTDDPNGISGWKKGEFTPNVSGSTSVEMEPSLFVQADGTIVMIFRDQNSSYTKLASYSLDDGVTWSEVVPTNMPDARTKQSAGNLSDGTAFMAGCPVNDKLRSPLAVTLSADGEVFDHAYLLRSTSSDPELIYEGTAKRLGFHYTKSLVYGGYLFVGYATNKEAVEISIIPEASLMLN